MTSKEKMHSGELDKREALLKEMFAEIGEGCYIEPPFHANWGGHLLAGVRCYCRSGYYDNDLNISSITSPNCNISFSKTETAKPMFRPLSRKIIVISDVPMPEVFARYSGSIHFDEANIHILKQAELTKR